jgi:hypothetical protein
MQNSNRNLNSSPQIVNAGRPTMPLGKQPVIEKKISDPSSSPRGERYPVPSLLDYRSKSQRTDFHS